MKYKKGHHGFTVWKQLRKFFHFLLYRRVKWQMLIMFIFVAAIPTLIIGGIAVLRLRNQMVNSYQIWLEAERDRVKAILFDITTSMHSISEPIVSVQSYGDVLGMTDFLPENKSVYQMLERSMFSLKQSTAAISSITIYTNNPHIPVSGQIVYMENDFKGCEWYEKMEQETWEKWTYTTVWVNKAQKDEELTLIRRINIGSVPYKAYLVITISSNHLRNRLLNTDSFIMASVGDDNCIFSTDYRYEDKIMPLMDNVEENYYNYLGAYELEGKNVLAVTSFFQAYLTKDRFYIMVCNQEAYEQIDILTGMMTTTILFAFMGLCIIILIFTSSFSRRVTTLRVAMNRASQGDYDIVDEFRGIDELAEIFADLKRMVNMIRKKEAEFYTLKLEEQRLLNMQQEMELKMLVSQINPHFLYNTLELIRMKAISMNNKNVAGSILLLARSMRYVLEHINTDDSTLEKELNHVENYLKIQEMRFGERAGWDFYFDEDIDIKKCSILPLLIQPVVENAIIHGIEGKEGSGHISIILEMEADDIIITVRDNGIGMDEEQLGKVQKKLNKQENEVNESSSIGLYNVNQRIKIRYGDMYGLQIKSELHKGTSVSLKLPCIETDVKGKGVSVLERGE